MNFRFAYATGSSLGWSMERFADGAFLDFSGLTFKSSGWTTQVQGIAEDTGSFAGRWKVTLDTSNTSVFANGDYCITIHNTALGNQVVAEMMVTIVGGSDAVVIPAPAGAAMSLTASERNAVADAYLDRTDGIEPGETPRQFARKIRAALVGVCSAAGVFKRKDGTTTSFSAVVPGDGSRTSVTDGTN